MIRVLISLILIFSLSSVSAGKIPLLYQYTSLVSIQNETADSSRIADLLKQCWDNRNSNPELAIKYGNEAIDLANKYSDYTNLSAAYSFVGVAYRVMGKYSKALDCYYLGLDIALKNEIPEQAGYAYLNLANLYVYQELITVATDNLRKARPIAESSGNKRMLAYLNLYAGKIYSLTGKPDSALACYNVALVLRQELNQVADQATCYKYIGDIYSQTGDYKSAIGNYNLSLEKVDMQNDKDLYANLLIDKSKILLLNNNIGGAKASAVEALEIGRKIGAAKTIKDALEVQSEISFLTKDYKSAAEFQRKVILYDDSLFSKQLSEKIFFLEYQLEREQRNAKIDILNKDNSIKELQLKRGRFITIGLTIILLLLAAVYIVSLMLLRQRRKHEMLLELNNQEILRQRDSIEQQNRQLTETNNKLEKSQEELKRIVLTKDKLLSIIAHDLRNPFTALIGLTDLLRENADTISKEELKQYISMIDESSHKLLLLIENLLAWARSQTASLKPAYTNLNLKSQVADVMNLYISQAETKGVALKNEIPENQAVYTDPKIFATIVRNLISNSIKYTRKGGSVICSSIEEKGSIVLKVSDNGIGMKEELVKKLFRIEDTVTTNGTNSESGTGLGLIICKEFTETLGGTIAVESTVGVGTVFSVSLPILKP